MAQRALFVTKLESDTAVIEVDSCLDETHTLTNVITDHPVEHGFNVTDHSRPEPDKVSLRCFVSNTPLSLEEVERSIRQGNIEWVTSASRSADLSVTGIDGRGAETFTQLDKMRTTGALLSVVTTLKTYASSDTEGMLIESITIPRTRQNYDGLEFTVNLKQVSIITNRSTRSKNTDKRTRKKKKQGQKLVDKEHGPEQRKVTAAKQTARGLGYGK
jgi:hypothetical protein